MNRFVHTVLAYHGCRAEVAEGLLSGKIPIERWKLSRNRYDWLGDGIYFWEYAPARARSWRRSEGVVGAIIQLDQCLDLTDIEASNLLADEFENVRESYEATGRPMPTNGGRDGKRRGLDRLVINSLAAHFEQSGYNLKSVRGAFLEGDPAFPGSRILRESHVQIAVRDPGCIVGVFRPNIPSEATP